MSARTKHREKEPPDTDKYAKMQIRKAGLTKW